MAHPPACRDEKGSQRRHLQREAHEHGATMLGDHLGPSKKADIASQFRGGGRKSGQLRAPGVTSEVFLSPADWLRRSPFLNVGFS